MIALPKAKLFGLWSKQCPNVLGSIRTGIWPAHYQEPVENLKELDSIKKNDPDKYEQLSYSPIKPRHHFKSDSLFFDPFLHRFEGKILMKGQRLLAQHLINETLFEIKCLQLKKWHAAKNDAARDAIVVDPRQLFRIAFENCKPVLDTKMLKRGGAKYQVPHALSTEQSISKAIKWIRDTIRERPKPRKIFFPEALAKEMVAASKNEGKVVKIKNDLHKLCETNKAYVHYRWA